MTNTNEDKLTASLRSKLEPSEQEYSKLQAFLLGKYGSNIAIEWVEDSTVLNGFILQVGHDSYDWSLQARTNRYLEAFKNINYIDDDYISILEETSSHWRSKITAEEIGTVISVGDGIARIEGLDHVGYNEIVIFENGTKGVILDIRSTIVACNILGDTDGIFSGQNVYRSKKNAAVPVSYSQIGRVLNALGSPIDGGEAILETEFYPVERTAPSIIARSEVRRPLYTGILAIDSMFPIGRGQRELIIGDRQSGKTAIAVDTILNQKGKNTICIYVAIGKKASEVSLLSETLRANQAMEYTIIVSATAGDTTAIQYLAPYSATAIGEYFMDQGRDVLIVYDDLSKHAVAYRSISLLLGRLPGREAYPGDIFYLHSRLLERSAQLSAEYGGGSLTALPIVETQSGDISAYIPTNVISITDGQIFLETDLFLEGHRPAINVGLSVSRVGGSAQEKAMKYASKSLKSSLSQYNEMKVFARFSSDLDPLTKRELRRGESLTKMLIQKQYVHYSLAREVIYLILITKGLMDAHTNQLHQKLEEVFEALESSSQALLDSINETGLITETQEEDILNMARGLL